MHPQSGALYYPAIAGPVVRPIGGGNGSGSSRMPAVRFLRQQAAEASPGGAASHLAAPSSAAAARQTVVVTMAAMLRSVRRYTMVTIDDELTVLAQVWGTCCPAWCTGWVLAAGASLLWHWAGLSVHSSPADRFSSRGSCCLCPHCRSMFSALTRWSCTESTSARCALW